MRLHSLAITAFGPFAETVEVDFDTLSEANVFLLCGATGAGKSTVLDAVCFAFYGAVPSDRGAAKALRSHHAAPGVAPRVVLETSIQGRRFRFTRSPAWQRPKKRGSGETTEQAAVLVEEHVDDAWVSRTNRLDEAGLLVSGLLGMNLDQFRQVVLLPQGQFDTFLRATSEHRHAVLTQLFRTRRFEDVERWLVERRTTLRRASDAARDDVSTLLHRLSEAAGIDLPDLDLDQDAIADLEHWAGGLAPGTTRALIRTTSEVDSAAAALDAATSAHDEGRRLAGLRARHRDATRRQSALAAGSAVARRDRARLDAARRAVAVVPVARVADDAAVSADLARAGATRALQALTGLLTLDPDEVDPDRLAEAARAATARAALARDFLPRATRLEQAQALVGTTTEQIARTEVARAEVADWLGDVPARRTALADRAETLRATGATLAPVKARIVELGRLLSQFAVAEELDFQVADARRKRDDLHRVTLDLREGLHDLREQRLAGMAAELASAMVVGGGCPVCGSCQHPAPAVSRPGAPTKSDEQAMRQRVDDSEIVLLAQDDQMHNYRTRLAAVRAGLGSATVEETTTALAAEQVRLGHALQSGAALAPVEAELAALITQERQRTDQLAAHDNTLATARARQASARDQVATLSADLAALLGPDIDPDSTCTGVAQVGVVARRSTRLAELLERARSGLLEQARRDRARLETDQAAQDAARAHGFTDRTAAVAAALEPAALVALEARLAERVRDETQVAAVLDDPDVVAALACPEPDLAALDARREVSIGRHAGAMAALRAAEVRHERVTARVGDLRAGLSRWAPLRAEHDTVRSLSEFTEGRGPDNTRQMRLSAYVLAARLSQVVAAANERLVRMSDDRYLLEHTADRAVGDRRGGLSLLVRDQWTDEARDPVTLSGGETFVVSLALALGLADVVTGEAGGTRVDTLFVDEGFGSLDADTLELVMDTLDGLREGGRVVGVVSHVGELRTRIPTQLAVHKGRDGSRVELRRWSG